MAAVVRFGPAGLPIPPFEGGAVEAMKFVKDEGLDAMEIEFVRGVHMSVETARKVRSEAERYDVRLSAHCPYWINCAAKDAVKIKTTIRNLMETARIAHVLGAKVIVFHPSFYMGRTPEATMELTRRTLKEVEERMEQEGIRDVWLGAETAGKVSQLGGLEETLELAGSMGKVRPVIDFAHLHARGKGWIKGKGQYSEIFGKIEKALGRKAVEDFHSHFSEIQWNEGGERNHVALGELEKPSPAFRPLCEVVAENGYSGTIICETPMLDRDAVRMKRMFGEISRKA